MPLVDGRQRLVEKAVAQLGGADKLAKKLGVSEREVEFYMSGKKRLPDALFLKIVDMITDEWLIQQPPPKNTPKTDR